VTVIYRYSPAQNKGDSFYFGIRGPVNRTRALAPASEYRVLHRDFARGDSLQTMVTFDIRDTTVCFVADGLGHEFFALPGDTVTIRFAPKPRIGGKLVFDGERENYFFHYFQYEGKNKDVYLLFDSLVYLTGSIHLEYPRVHPKDTSTAALSAFFHEMTDRYAFRMSYATDYCRRHRVPASILRLAASEIRSAYLMALLQPPGRGQSANRLPADYPPGYIDTLRNARFADAYLFYHTYLYSIAAMDRERIFEQKLLRRRRDPDETFSSMYDDLFKMPGTPSTRGYLLSGLLRLGMDAGYAGYDSLLNLCIRTYPHEAYTRDLDSTYRAYIAAPKLTIQDALAAMFSDTAGKMEPLRSLLKGKPVVIDCWASWCKPCLAQMPHTALLATQYGDRVDFIYLSFDRKNEDWLHKLRELNLLKNSYLLNKHFSSPFARYLRISSIPRYILMDRSGKIVNDNPTGTGNEHELETSIEKLITTAG